MPALSSSQENHGSGSERLINKVANDEYSSMISLICSSMRLFDVMRAAAAQDVALLVSRDYFEGRRDDWNRHDSISAANFFFITKKMGSEELRAGTLIPVRFRRFCTPAW